MVPRFSFIGGDAGVWRVSSIAAVRGDALAGVARLAVTPSDNAAPVEPQSWRLEGLISNLRYAERDEVAALRARQEGLGRAAARCAALIPIRKSAAWWAMAQDERRALFETQSRHTAIGLEYLPAIARQLYHSRDLAEPFDFLTWFEFAPEHTNAFDELLSKLRATEEWRYVEREVDIRLSRD